MATKRKKSLAAPFNSVDISKATPYVQRLAQDADVRANVKSAFDSSRSAYERLSNGKAPHRALIEDKKLQNDLQQAYEAIRQATSALAEGPQKPRRKGLGFGGKLLLVVATAGVALAVSEKLRTKVLDMVFGKEEEFEYTPPPSTPPPSTPPTPAAA